MGIWGCSAYNSHQQPSFYRIPKLHLDGINIEYSHRILLYILLCIAGQHVKLLAGGIGMCFIG